MSTLFVVPALLGTLSNLYTNPSNRERLGFFRASYVFASRYDWSAHLGNKWPSCRGLTIGMSFWVQLLLWRKRFPFAWMFAFSEAARSVSLLCLSVDRDGGVLDLV